MSDTTKELREQIAAIFDAYRIENNERGLGMLDIEPSVDQLMQLHEAECRRREGEARIDELERFGNYKSQYENRDDLNDTAAARIAELKATISGEGAE
jgi:hypothetical protein